MTLSTLDSASTGSVDRPPAVDLIGVGFGPSNLALAATIEEELGGEALSTLFFECKEDFAWHPGMLLSGARIQLSFLKDLATLRDPQSRFTFLKYLQVKGRLDTFINLRSFYPTRIEFCDYYGWVADQLRDRVRYSTEVRAVRPVEDDRGEVCELEVEARDLATGGSELWTTRNLVMAVGGEPRIPAGVEIGSGRRCFHSQDFLQRLREGFPDPQGRYCFVVVGSGQTAAEIFQYLYQHYPRAEVTAAVRRFAYKPADDSHFVNEIFFPDMVDTLYRLTPERRRTLLETHMDTNYSAVDSDLIAEIYDELYERRVRGDRRIGIRPFLELRELSEADDRVTLRFTSRKDGTSETLEADAAILATGFERPRLHSLLTDLAQWFIPSGDGGFEVSRNFRLRTRPGFEPNVFLQGFCEETHGLSDTLLSTLPIRSCEILSEIAQLGLPAAETAAVREAVAVQQAGAR